MASRFPLFNVSDYPQITLDDLPDERVILRDRMLKVKELWTQYDPPLGAAYDVENLEFDPIKINQEANTFFQMNEISALNAWGRATTLAFSWGQNLDAIASRYPGGIKRMPKVASPRPVAQFPQDWEDDERFRRRIWLSPNAFNTAGAEEAYVFWALTQDVDIRDATATVERFDRLSQPKVIVTIAKEGENPMPTDLQIEKVRSWLARKDIRPLTDVVTVQKPRIVHTKIKARLLVLPGFDSVQAMDRARASLTAARTAAYWLGFDFNVAEVVRALKVPGVQNVLVDEPLKDSPAGPQQIVVVDSVDLIFAGRAE